ncbi:MAG: hypothetical protein AAF614_30995 [Chloroflexota bacterium]
MAIDNAKTIAVGQSGFIVYADTDGNIHYRALGEAAEVWHRGWDQRSMGKAAVVALGYEDRLSCLNTKGEVWFIEDGQGEKFVEVLGNQWRYTVKPNDHLYEIVRREFGLKNPTEIDHLVDRIAKDSGIRNRNRLQVGDVLTLNW